MSNTFLSFLGIGNYTECNYFRGIQKVNNVKYVQEATLQLFCNHYDGNDRVLIFLTEEARKKNWEDNGHRDFKTGEPMLSEGLCTRLKKLNLSASVHDIDIPNGFNEKEIWDIFRTVYEQIGNGDRIILDITHAFRSIPMLGIVLIDYMKSLKAVSVDGIYYGAFEALSPEKRNGPIQHRDAEMLNLTSFSELQDWTDAADAFTLHGKADLIKDLTDRRLQNFGYQTEEDQKIRGTLKKFGVNVDLFVKSIATVRGYSIIKGDVFDEIRKSAQQTKAYNAIAPLQPLLDKIADKAMDYRANDLRNCLLALQWCVDNNMIQQGITLLQEVIVTYICYKFDEEYTLDHTQKKHRDFVSKCLGLCNAPSPRWHFIDEKDREIAEKLSAEKIFKDIQPYFEKVKDFRNSINHGGFTDDISALRFEKVLNENHRAVIEIINKNL